MGATYTRQSDYSDGDTITAADTNDEFDQLLAAFAASSGHTHDGTTAEGGPVTKLLGNTLTFGAGTSGTDITITFDGETNDGVFKWMEDEDYFEFSDDILIASTEKIQFRDTAIYINSSADGQLDLVADTEIQIAATTVDINGAVEISGTTAQVGVLTTTATQVATGGITSGSNIVSDTDSTDDLGTTSVRWANLYVDAITATDQITATGFTGTLDGILGSGSAAAATVTTLDTSGAVNLNLVTDSTSSTSGALIVDGGVGIAKKLYVGTDLDVDGTTNLDVVDIDGAVDMASTLAVAGVLTGASLDISGDIDIDGTANLDIVDIDGAVDMATTLAVAGNVDFNGDLDVDGTTNLDVVDIDGAVDMASTLQVDGAITNSSTIVSAGKITADAGIDIDNFNIDGTTIALSSGNLDIDVAGNVTIDADGGTVTFADGGASLGTITSSGYSGTAAVATTVTITDNESTNENNAIVFTSGGDLDGGNIGLESDGDLKYNPSTGTLSATNISVSGTFSTVDSVTMSANNAVIFEGATADAHETTLTVVDATADRTITLPNVSGTVPVLAAASNTQVTSTPEELNLLDGITAGTVSASLAVIADSNKDITGFRNVTLTGELDAGSLDVSGDIDVDGTTNLDVVDIDGAVDMASTLTVAGVVDITDTTDSSDATGDTGALRTEGGASIAKKLYVGTDLDVDGTANLDIVDIDGAVDMASTLTVGGVVSVTDGSAASPAITNTGDTNTGIYWLDADKIAVTTAGSTRLSIDSNGFFDVTGAGNDIARFSGANSAALFIRNDTANQFILHTSTDDALVLGTGGNNDRLTIDSAGAATFSGTLTSTGKITADAGIDIDNFNIDGTTIALSSGNMTLDAAGSILLDSADGGSTQFQDSGTAFGNIYASSGNMLMKSTQSDKDMTFQGNDGGSQINALVLDMSAAGAATFNNDVTAFSDERLKSNITTIPDALSKVSEMRGVHYVRNETGKDSTGVIAQELQKIAPELVLTAEDEMGTLSVNYGNITGYLIEAIKELSARVKELESK